MPLRGRDSVAVITTCYGLDGPGFEICCGGLKVSAPVQTDLEDYPAFYTTGAEAPRAKAAGA